VAHRLFSLRLVNQFDLCGSEISGCWCNGEVFELNSLLNDVVERGRANEDIVDRLLVGAALEADSARGIALGIAVNEQGPLLRHG
jgi:hypothetical protein